MSEIMFKLKNCLSSYVKTSQAQCSDSFETLSSHYCCCRNCAAGSKPI